MHPAVITTFPLPPSKCSTGNQICPTEVNHTTHTQHTHTHTHTPTHTTHPHTQHTHTHNTPTHTHTTHPHTHVTVVMLSCSHDGWTLLSCFHLALLKLLTAHSHTFLDEHTYPLRLTHSNSTHPHFFCVTSSTTPHTLVTSQSNPHLSPPLHHPATQSLTPSSSNFRIFRFLCSTLCLFLI